MRTVFFLILFHSLEFQDDIFYGRFRFDSDMEHEQNLLSLVRDQNQPRFCKAGWAFAPVSAMAVQFNRIFSNRSPQVVLSPQMVINCRDHQYQNFDCSDDASIEMPVVLEQLKNEGVSEEGCNNFYANTELNCSSLNKCKDCGVTDLQKQTSTCFPVRYKKYKIKSYQ